MAVTVAVNRPGPVRDFLYHALKTRAHIAGMAMAIFMLLVVAVYEYTPLLGR